ncbi:MAG: phenylacetic acid degradation operon negative regulatory protein [Candidatus Azotimanducaceae bacterium]|jgi:phenylacetic acid degradation operon negative regulatory protein
MIQRNVLTRVLTEINKEQSLSGTSIIVTVFGDSVSQHGGSIWLGSLIRALAPLGINERLVRTSVFRLVNDRWLSVRKIARRSYYSFTDSGKSQFERVARRIYQTEQQEWDNRWTLLVLSSVPAEKKDELRKKLLWQGFGQLGHDLFAHHRFDNQSLDEIMDETSVMNDVVILHAEAHEFHSRMALKALAQEKWGIAELEGRYKRFLVIFRPVLDAIIKKIKLDPEVCFLLRILLIHEYRRILLKDRDLPIDLLPSGWPGLNARNLTVNLYSKLSPMAEDFITSELESAEGPLPKASYSFHERFN